MADNDYPGVGSPADQYARLTHAVEQHGLGLAECPSCGLDRTDLACRACGGTGAVGSYLPGSLAPCGPRCPLLETVPS